MSLNDILAKLKLKKSDKSNNFIWLIVLGILAIILLLLIYKNYYLVSPPEQPAAFHMDEIQEEQLTEDQLNNLSIINDKISRSEELSEEDLINLAMIQKHSGNFNYGIEILLYAYEKNQDNVLIQNNLADLYYANKEYLKAEEWYLESIEKSPTWILGYENLYSLYKYQLKEKMETFPDLINRGMELDFTGQEKYNFNVLLGNYHLDNENYQEALKAYRKALEARPEDPSVSQIIEQLESN